MGCSWQLHVCECQATQLRLIFLIELHLQLFDNKTGDLVARSRWSECGARCIPTQHLEVKHDGLIALNAIIVTFIILEQQRRDAVLRTSRF